MKRVLPTNLLCPARILRPGFLACLLILSPLLAARGDQHWTTNHVHKGILTSAAREDSPNALDDISVAGGRNYLGRFTLSYAVWSLLKEPVHDYIFTWEWHAGDHLVGNGPSGPITTRDLAKYPDLARQFSALKPISVTLTTDIEFYDAKNERMGWGRKTVVPDLVEAAGSKEPLHVPGSPHWADFFQYEYRDAVHGHNFTREDRAAKNKKLFADAVRVQLVSPRLTTIEWPEGSLQLIAGEFTRREVAEKKRLADALAREKERVAQASAAAKTNKAVKPGPGPNPFEQAAAGKAGGFAPNPFEEAARGNTRTSPANPFELDHEGVRAGPENPFEKEARLDAEKRARQAAIRREQERQAEIARVELERKEMEARAEAQRRRDYQEALAAAERNAENAAADRAYRRAYNQQNRQKASWEANQSRGGFKSFLDPALFGNNSAPSGYVDPNKIVGHVPSSRSGGGSGNQPGAGAGGGTGTSPVDRACMACGGSGRVLSAKSEAAYQQYKAELEANKGKGGVVPGFSGEEVPCSACGGTGQR